MDRLRLACLLLVLALAPACADGSPEPGTASAESDSRLAIPSPPPIPAFAPPDLAPGSLSIVIVLHGEPDAAVLAQGGGRLVLNTNDTRVEVEAESGDTQRSLLEKAARKFLADGWILHLESGASPRLFLHMRPGTANLSVQVASQVPGVGVSWSLG